MRHLNQYYIALPPLPPSASLCICVNVRGQKGGRQDIYVANDDEKGGRIV